MISNVYERRLLDQIQEVPRHVVLVVAEKDLNTVEAYKKLGAFISWCLDIGISRVTVYINMLHLGEEVNQKLRSQVVQRISDCLQSTAVAATIYSPDGQTLVSSDQAPAVSISIGYGGKKELVDAIRSIAQKVKDKELRAEDISEETVTCSLTRIRPLWRAVMHPKLEVDYQFLQQLPYHTKLTGVAISRFKAHLKGFKWYESTSSETTFVFAQKGRIGRFGPYIAHFGVLILLLGVVIGAAFGQTNPSNDTITVIPVGGSQQVDSFVLRLDSFNVSYYDNGAVREYRAIVTIIDGNQVQTRDITINGPTNYKGLTFLLYGYDSQGVIESGKASWVAFQIKNDTGITLVWTGAAVTLLGIMLSLYISHKRVWIKLYKEQITLGAISNKNVVRFLKNIDNLCAKLEDHS